MSKPVPKFTNAGAKQRLKKLFASPNATDLRWNFEVGELVAFLHPTTSGKSFGTSVLQDLAELVDPEPSKNLPNQLRKARAFYLAYQQEGIAGLLDLKDKEGQPLRWLWMSALLSERDAKKRTKIMEQSLSGCWTIQRLRTELQQRHGKREFGGRRPTVPKSTMDLLNQVTQLCERWQRWGETLGVTSDEPSSAVKKLTPKVRKQLVATLRQVENLHKVAAEQAEQLGRK